MRFNCSWRHKINKAVPLRILYLELLISKFRRIETTDINAVFEYSNGKDHSGKDFKKKNTITEDR